MSLRQSIEYPRIDGDLGDYIEEYDRLFGRSGTDDLDVMDSLGGVLSQIIHDQWHRHGVDAVTSLWLDGWRPIGLGTTRITFGKEGHPLVAKVPIDDLGVACCMREERHSIDHGKDGRDGEIPIAECWLDEERLILWMERVTPEYLSFSDESTPSWVWLVDGAQVGRDQDGVLVAYDL